MKFKKYATLILLTILVIGFSKNTVFAAAKAAGTSTKAAVNTQNKTSSKKSYKKSDLRLMASIINCEAGGESYQGKLASWYRRNEPCLIKGISEYDPQGYLPERAVFTGSQRCIKQASGAV